MLAPCQAPLFRSAETTRDWLRSQKLSATAAAAAIRVINSALGGMVAAAAATALDALLNFYLRGL